MNVKFDPEDISDMVDQPTSSAELLAERVGTEIPLAIGKLFWALPILWEMHGEICRLKKRIDDVERNIDEHTLRP